MRQNLRQDKDAEQCWPEFKVHRIALVIQLAFSMPTKSDYGGGGEFLDFGTEAKEKRQSQPKRVNLSQSVL